MDITNAINTLGEKFGFAAVDTNHLLLELNLPRTAKILDVGTGIGSMAITLALHGYNVITGEPGDDTTHYAKQDWLYRAKKVNVDHLIKFQPFNAKKMHFKDVLFNAIFSLGTFHHILVEDRPAVINEFIRITSTNAIISLLEPNEKTVEMIRENDPLHPEAADPAAYIQNHNLKVKIIEGIRFDAFVLEKL